MGRDEERSENRQDAVAGGMASGMGVLLADKGYDAAHHVATNHGHEVFCHCFPGSAVVTVQHRGQVAMSTLGASDQVLDVDGCWTPVLCWLHCLIDQVAQYIEVCYDGGSVTASANHFIFIHDQGGKTSKPVGEVLVGDFLVDSTGSPKLVKETKTCKLQGVYCPFTASGTLVVDNVAVSSYSTVTQLQLDQMPEFLAKLFKSDVYTHTMHASLTPVRWYHQMIGPDSKKADSSYMTGPVEHMLNAYRTTWAAATGGSIDGVLVPLQKNTWEEDDEWTRSQMSI